MCRAADLEKGLPPKARSNTWIIAIVIVTLALALGLGVGLGVGLNKKEDSTISTYPTIADVACGTNAPPQFSTLCTAIAASPTVLAALSAAGTYTVFAPNNDAFDALPDGALADLLADETALTNLLLKHTLGSKVPAADALNLVNEPVDTLASTNSITEKIVVDGNGTAGPVTITPAIVGGSAEVVTPNLAEADNGNSVIHEINKVIATWSYMSIAQVACDPSLDATVGTLCAAVGASSAVADALSNSGTYTVFAPTNGAFAALDQTFLQSVLADDATVTALLQKHALGSMVPASVALTLTNSAQTTLNGEDITVDGSTSSVLVTPSILGGPSTVISADVQTSNGVIHVVDKVLALAALVPPPSPPPPVPPPSSPPPPTIADVACGTNAPPQFSTLCTAIAASPTVLAALSAAGTYTVFAPNNDAFDALPDGALTNLLADETALTNLLLKHTLGSKVPAATALTLVNSVQATQNTAEKIVVDGSTGDVLVTPTILGGKAKVVTADIMADNGVIHEINKVIATSSFLSDTIAGKACDAALTDTVGTLCAAVQASTTVEVALSDVTGTFTVFAPDNAAFAALPAGTVTDLLLPENEPDLTNLLLKHALGSVVPASDALTLTNSTQTTLNGEDITVDGSTGSVLVTPSILGGPSTVISADVQTGNGVIHVVDKVLAPAP